MIYRLVTEVVNFVEKIKRNEKNTKMIQTALNIIDVAFAGKKDKAGKPYIGHLHRAKDNVKKYYKDFFDFTLEDLEIVALLHDLIEDYPEWTLSHIKAIFNNERIVKSLDLLTKRKGQIYDEYVCDILDGHELMAVIVKLGDLEDNMDLTRLPQFGEEEIKRTFKYHKAYVKLTSRYKTMINLKGKK